jgi:alanine racemase
MLEALPRIARVDLDALRSNYRSLEQLAAGRKVIAVVKADAYGHGVIPVARALCQMGCSMLAVVTLKEAMELRAAQIKVPILLLGGVGTAQEASRVLALNLVPVLHHRRHLEFVAQAVQAAQGQSTPCDVQVEVDTGMRRMGVSVSEAEAFIAELAATDGIRLQGVFTHLACADEEDLAPTREQLRLFSDLLDRLEGRGLLPPEVHVLNSAGLLASAANPEFLERSTAVRPGLSLYGVLPAPHFPQVLEPVMSVTARVAQARDLSEGDAVGYGATHRCPKPTRVLTLPLGYADGVPCHLANVGEVLVGGERRPIVGRVSMDLITIDAGADEGKGSASLGEEVLFFGKNAQGCLRVEEVAAAANTISYELLVRVGRRVPRVIVDKNPI